MGSRRANADDCAISCTVQVPTKCRGDEAGSVKGPFSDNMTLSCLATLREQLTGKTVVSKDNHVRTTFTPQGGIMLHFS